MFRLDTKDLEAHILKEIKPIQELINLKELHFTKNSSGSEEGTYIFSDQQGYHFVYSERGNETKHKVTDNLFEITFWTINSLVGSIAFELMKKNIKKGENQRKYIFEQRLILLERIGTNYKKAGEIEIDEILKENPL
ncbi:Imm63 family immunity protein [Alkaliphilus crotonatoxidans]